MHEKEIFFNYERVDCNIMHLPKIFETELQELNEEILFYWNSLKMSGYLKTPNEIYEAKYVTEKELRNK